ncbi:unnamed protein product [Linum trigynum]|uniref:Uncharacterized protein n=1 Tax=Linum trigynum TaxID=586398 RepID=A0AAV2FSE9_9ROSI
MNTSRFFDSEWICLNQMLQQSLHYYEREERERAAAAGQAMAEAATAAANEEEQFEGALNSPLQIEPKPPAVAAIPTTVAVI